MKDMVRLLMKADIELLEIGEAKARWLQYRLRGGMLTARPILSTEEDNMKLGKSAKVLQIHTLSLSLAPAKSSVLYNVCRYSTEVCVESCVAHTGNGRWDKTKDARALKTQFLADDPSAFMTLVVNEIDLAVERHKKVAVRLNTFSDIPWENVFPLLFERWDDNVTFYDYTKWPVAERPDTDVYDLTRSAHERHSNDEIKGMLDAGSRVAVCLDIGRKGDIPDTYLGFPTVDGDKHDARFTEPKATVVVLRPKGSARKNGYAREVIL